MIRRVHVAAMTAGLVLATGCGGSGTTEESDVWFEGDLQAALTEAEAEDTIVMADFFTEW